jgi:dipeptidyl aminopeptidase/acylaminoacyl peptidase
VLDIATRQWRLVLPQSSGALYSRTGHLLFMTNDGGGGLFAIPFDAASASVSGSPLPVAEGVSLAQGFGHPHAAVSDTGTLVYLKDAAEPQSLLWADRQGRLEPVWKSPNGVITPRLSPDARRVAFFDKGPGPGLWSLDLDRHVERLMTREIAANPVWTDDGAHLALCSNHSGNFDLYEIPAEGGEPRPLLVRTNDQCPESWARSPQGPLLAYTEWHPANGTDLWILPADGKPIALAATAAREVGSSLSPDGRYLAYVSDESGRDQVYVRVLKTTQTISVSSEGGGEPLWARDGRELFFRSGDRFMVVAVAPGSELRLLPPQLLFEHPFEHYFYEPVANYDVSPDGRRFLVASDTSTSEIQLVVNWAEELKQKPNDARGARP